MARNEMTEGAGLNRILSDAFGVQGAAAPFMASEVFPMLVLGNDRAEWKYLSGERLAGVVRGVTGSLGNISHAGLYNSAGSGILGVIQSLNIMNHTGATDDFVVSIGASPFPVGGASQGFYRDRRWGDALTGLRAFYRLNATAVGDSIWGERLTDDESKTVKLPIILPPGSFVACWASASNVDFTTAWEWYEYGATDGELRGI